MNLIAFSRFARAATCGALAFTAVTLSAAIPAAEKFLPADTLAVFCVPDAAKLNAAYHKSPQVQMWHDAAMKPFKDKFMAKWEADIVKPLEKELGVKFADYTGLAQGVVTLAITQDGWDAKSDKVPGFVVLLDTRDRSGQLKTNLAELRKRWVDAGKGLRSEKIRDVEFTVVTISTNDIPKTVRKFLPSQPEVQEIGKTPAKDTAAKNEIFLGQFESALIFGSSLPSVEKLMTRLTGGAAPALGDDAHFELSRSSQFREASLYGWLNVRRIMDIVLKLEAPKPNPDAPSLFPALDPPRILKALGLADLNAATLAYQDAPEGGLVTMSLQVPDASRQGLFKMVAIEPKDSQPPAFVPADVVRFSRVRFDSQKGIAALERAIKDISPELSTTWDFMLKSGSEALRQSMPDFDIRKDLFGNLGDDIISYAKSPRDATLEALLAPPELTLIGSPSPDKLAAALKAVFVLTSPDALTPKEREFLGRKIFTITAPTLPMTASPGAPSSLHYSASGGYLALSTDAAILEEYLRTSETPPKPLRDVGGLAEAAQRVGGQSTGLFVFEQQAEAMKLAFNLLKKAGTDKDAVSGLDLLTGGLPIAGPESSFKEWMDFSLLPEFDKVAKYFHYAVTSGSMNKDALTLKVFTPVPPGLKK